MEIDANTVRALRDRTGAGMMDCKKALAASNGDVEKAVEHLRKMGIASADKRSHREAMQGRVECYLHPGNQIGVLLEVNSETDFVAKTEDFKSFCHEVAMHIAATRPLAVSPDDLDPAFVAKEREIYLEQVRQSGKPENIWERIIEGRMKKFHEEVCLLDQPWVKDNERTIETLRKELSGKVGENIIVRRFAVFQVGQR
ncbi:MAG: translation elongation factor Ts [Candidatus Eisenbacteria bacterium]|nr:translation elongation factor Ts [Candidatus Eisenbacteria bacterium]